MSHSDKIPMTLSELLLGLEELVESLGGDLAALLLASGIAPEVLGRTGQHISLKTFAELLELGAEQCGCPTFSLELAKRQEAEPNSTFIQMLKSAPNLQAMEPLASKYRNFHSEVTYWDIAIDGDYTTVIRRSDYPIDPAYHQYRLFLLAKSTLFLRSLFAENWVPKELYFSFSKPEAGREIRAFFRAPIHYNFEFDGLLMATVDRDRKVVSANRNLLSLLESHAEQLKPSFVKNDSYCAMTKRAMVQRLGSGLCNLASVAAVMGISSRKLQRCLKAEGIVFRVLLTEVRCELAKEKLTYSDLPLTQLAQMLGYSELSAFSRAFKGFCGVAPEVWRERYAKQVTLPS